MEVKKIFIFVVLTENQRFCRKLVCYWIYAGHGFRFPEAA